MDGTDIKSMPMSYSDHAGRDTGKGEPLDLGNISIGPVTDYGAALSGTQVLQDLLAKEPVNTDTLSDGSVVDCGDDFGMGDAHDAAKSPSTEISPMSDSPEEGSVVLTFKTSQPSLASSLDQKTLSWASFAIVVASHAGSTNCCFTDICDAIPLSQTDDFNLASSLMSSSQLNIEFDWKSDVQELLQVVQAHSVTSKGNGLQCLIKNLALKWLGGDVIDHEKGACTDCQIDCSVLEDEIHLTFTIDSALVDVESVKYMFWQYETTLHRLSSLSKEKGRPASDFQVANMQDLCKLWNWNAVVPLKVESLIHDRFALVVQRQPSLLAVSAHDGELTYSELAELSTKLALRLVSYGVQNSIVPVHIEKSVWVPVAQMAIMKAGAAAVLLDTSLPTERLRTIIQQVDPRLVLTSASSQAVTRRLSEKPSIVLDQTMFEQLPTSDTPLSLPVISPSARLYIVFTSGSTGTPKGATITHANFASAIEHQQNTLMFKTGQRVFDFASYAFDVAWSNFLHTITAGGCLCIPSDAERKQDIPGALHKYKAEYVHLTPSVAWFAPEDMPESVKIMHFSGEELKASIVQAFYRRACIINTYGPAECSVTSTMHKIQASSSQDPPIGRGLGCCTWAVSLDGTGLVPVGSIGELWIEGPIVGQGYLKDPAKTNATFVEDPEWLTRYPFHSSKPNRTGRLYRTGDLVRVNDDDGSLSFVGRKDSQVKIRGQRVELADIEHHMRQNLADDLKMSLKVAAEVMVPPGSKHPVLVAIMSPQEDKPRSVFLDMVRKAALHWDHTLSEVLPIYMVPSAYIPMEIIPMTPTGKTDRRQLRNLAADIFWDHAALEAGTEFALPSSEIEQQMLKVWSSVLNLPEVRISTNAAFTRLGGDSITAMQIVSRCRAQNIFFTVGDVLRLRSIREIARQSNNCQVADQPKIREDDPDGYYWMLSPVQQLFFAAHPNGINHYTQSFLLRVTSHITLEALSDAMKAVVQRHGMLRARFRRMEGSNNWEQTVVTPDRSSFAVEEHMYHSSDMFQDAIQTRQSSLDIRWGPVFAADLFSSDGEDQSLLLSAHHIIIDLVSWRVIWHDLSRCLSETGTLQLHRPPISFQAWCRLQYEEAQSLEPAQVLPHTVMASQLDYWGLETGDNSYSQSDHHERVLDADTTNLLLGRSNENLQTETLDILLGALVQSFREAFVDRQAPAVYLEGHGREPLNGFDIDIAETVGWFTTLHPVPVPGQVTDSVSDAIRFAKDARALVPGKGRPYIASYYHTKAGQEAFAHHQNVELLMNYRGVFQQLESAGALLQREDRAERAVSIQEFGSHYQRMALIEINVVIEYGCTRIATTTDRRMKHRDRLEHWLDLFPKTVERASRELLQIQPQKTLSDFPLLSISYASLDILLAATHAEAATGTEIVDIYPCTPMQEGIILSEKKGVASYRNSWVWLCFTSETSDTIIYPEQVKAAWEDVVRRHVVFATIFATHPDTGRPLQIVFDKSIPNCHIVEAASTQSATEHLLEMEAGATTIGRPDYSITICRDAMGDIACRLDMTHALIDASSIPVLLKDLANTYAGDASLRRSSPPLFREVVAFIQSSASSASRLDYWKLHLDSATPCRLLGDLQSVQSDRECSDMYGMIPLTETSTARIAAYCRKQDTTRAVLLQLAWALVLAQFTGKKDVCFGYVCSGRDTPVKDIESVVGPLISMLVARIDLDVSDIRTALKGTSEQSIEHLAHQHASLAEIQHALGLKEPLFNTAMTIREAHRYGNNDGLRLEEIREVDPHEYDVVLCAVLDGDSTSLSLQYRAHYMSDGLVRNIASGLELALEYLVGYTGASTVSASQSLYETFLDEVVGVNEAVAVPHWHKQLDGLGATVFPSLPSASYLIRPRTILEHTIQHAQWPGTYPASAYIRASWAVVQKAHTNTDDVLFGIISSVRKPSPQQVASALPVRILLGRDISIGELLDDIQAADDLGRNLNVLRVRGLSQDGLRAFSFQTALAIITPDSTDETSAASYHTSDMPQGTLATRPLALFVQCSIDLAGVRLRASFDDVVIKNNVVLKMLHQFERALEWLVTNADLGKKACEIEVVSRQDLLDIWQCNLSVPEPSKLVVHNIFTQTAQTFPNALAISAWDGNFTYSLLDELSGKLAMHLVQHEVGHNTVVPIYIEKSKWVAVAVLAVMKVGAASVLLDSTQPIQRAQSIAGQLKPVLILSSTANEISAVSFGLCDVLVLGDDLMRIISQTRPRRSLLRTSVPSDLLYIVFTSGSTGPPKGAMITHENFSSAIQHQQSTLRYGPGIRVYDFASYAFDVAWSNLLHSLTSGSCLCIPSDEQRKNDIVGSLQSCGATLADLTPSVLRLLHPQDLPKLKYVLLSGEAFTKASLGDWVNHPGLFNTYGPAECSVKATMASVTTNSAENDIGVGEGLVTWVVSTENPDILAPWGSVGELWLEGPLVGKGYLGDLEKTARSFVRDPAWLLRGAFGIPGRYGYLYRTGDLVRYDSSDTGGKVIFVGRKDSQIKINGQRVELGEIEHHIQEAFLSQHDENLQMVVDSIHPKDGANSVLVAFYASSKSFIPADLNRSLHDRLPGYMVPSAYIPLDQIPLGPTGKTDRRRLREIGASMVISQLSALDPANTVDVTTTGNGVASATEAMLLNIWADVLKTDVTLLTPNDSFLRKGGDSIGAMRLVALARQHGISLSVADIFKWPRLADLARKADKRPSSTVSESRHQQRFVPAFALLISQHNVEEMKTQTASLCNTAPANISDIFPCTPLQEALFAMTMRRSGDYILIQTRQLDSQVDPRRFYKAWETVVASMPILRTRIVHLPSCGLVQVVLEPDSIDWHRGNDLEEVSLKLKDYSIDLGTPLCRFGLVEGQGRVQFILSLHHALYDGWSLDLVEECLKQAYYGTSLTVYTPMQNFVQYIQQQQPHESVDHFWREQLEGAEAQPTFALPSPGYRPKSDQVHKLDISRLDWHGDFTASTLVRTAWAILMSAYSNSADPVFGVTSSGRQASMPGIERVAGPTIATVPLRIRINASESVEELLHRVQMQGVDIIPFEHVGLQRIQQLSLECEQACRFQTLLVIHAEEHQKPWSQPELFQSPNPDDDKHEDYDTFNTFPIMLDCQLRSSGMFLRVISDSRIVSGVTAQRIGQQLDTILRQLCSVAGRKRPVSEIRTASSQDLVDVWNWNAPIQGVNVCVHELVSQVARQQPDAPAICAWDGDFTYRELDQLSNQVAHSIMIDFHLTHGERTIIPLYFEKSRWMPVAQLGVMKAGATAVSLDANLPIERLESIIQQVNPPLMLSSPSAMDKAMRLGKPVMTISQQSLQTHSTIKLGLPTVDSSSTAYIVFTSGSTGTPKGAMVSHANIASAIHYQQKSLMLDSGSRVFDFVSYAFDVSWSNVLQTLCAGGCLCIPSESDRRNDPAGAILKFHVNYAHLTPTVARLLQGSNLPCLEIVSFIGEPLRAVDLAYWRDRVQVLNTYGPAECTPVATVHTINDHDGLRDPPVGLGVGAGTWVVDVKSETPLIAAIGAVGELWLEGPLVGQGYLNNNVKTLEAFVETPPWLAEGCGSHFPARRARLYRTGDLVRYTENGTLCFVGRKDSQVKIRGQRVELGEIEHHVRVAFSRWTKMKLTQVVAELITPSGNNDNSPRLVAFMQVQNGQEGSATGELSLAPDTIEKARSWLLQVLPSYMVPSIYIPVEEMPMTASGKTDRLAIRKRGALLNFDKISAISQSAQTRAPQTYMEHKVHDLVVRLNCKQPEQVSMDDNFIRAGGDSITAVQLVSMARKEGLTLSVMDILKARNLGELSSLCQPVASAKDDYHAVLNSELYKCLGLGSDLNHFFVDNELLPLVQCEGAKIVNAWPATTTQKAYVKDAFHQPRRSWYQFYIDFLTSVDKSQLVRSCQALLKHYEIFNTVFISAQGRIYQVLLEDMEFPIEEIDLLEESVPSAFERLRKEELNTPASFGMPFLQIKLLHRRDVGTRLMLSMSHALYDGISLSHIVNDLGALYSGIVLPRSPRFADYMDHVDSYNEEAQGYWQNQLRGCSVSRGFGDLDASVVLNSPPTVLEKVVSIARLPRGITAASLFTASCAIALTKGNVDKQLNQDIVIGRVVSTRATAPFSLQHVVGPCINTIPVRLAQPTAATEDYREYALGAVQLQYADSLRYQTFTPRPSVDDLGGFEFGLCSTTVGCTTQFQNINDRPPVLNMPVIPGTMLVACSDVDLPVHPQFLWLYGTPQPKFDCQDSIVVGLKVVAGSAFSRNRVTQILNDLCDAFVG